MATRTAGSRTGRTRAYLYPLGLWLLMAAVAVLNGVLRETLLIPRYGEYVGHVISTALLAAAIAVIAALYFRTTTIEYTRGELLAIGAVWVVLTVGFEFLVGFLEGTPVDVTLAQYDVLAGNVWILVPLTLLVAPLFFGAILAK